MMTPFERLRRLLFQQRKAVYLIVIYAMLAGLISLGLPLGVQAIISLIQGGTQSAALTLLILVIAGALALVGALRIMQLFITERLNRALFIGSTFEFAIRLPALRLDKKHQKYLPELVNYFFDTITVQKNLPKIALDLSTALLQIIFGLVLLSFYSSFFAFFAVILLLFLWGIFRLTGPIGLSTSIAESKYKYQTAFWLEELARHASMFKLFSAGKLPLKRADYLTKNWLGARRQHFRVLTGQFVAIIVFKVLITVVLLFLGSYLVINNQINIGQFVAAELVVIVIVEATEKLILSIEMMYDLLTSLDKLGSVLDLDLDKPGGQPFSSIEKKEGGVALSAKNLGFRYSEASSLTLKNLFFEISPKEKICLVGAAGAGKSSLIHIISTIFTDFDGHFAVNGLSLANIDLASFRKKIGLVAAGKDIFNGSLLENLTLGNPEITLPEVLEICHKIGLDSFLEKLPEGFETHLTATGRNIPASVATKIKVARALLKKPLLMVVEEAFSGLAPADRATLTNLLTDKNSPWTLVAISTDAHFAQKCDRVFVLQDGEMFAEGPFDLLKSRPELRSFFMESDLF